MQSAAFLEKEVSDLRAANEKQKQKRTRSRRYIPAEGGLSVQEASALIMQQLEATEAPPSGPGIPGEPAIQPRTRPPRGCGICRLPGHRRETCPDRLVS
jgi:TPP-dependent indolepyruvate ferredoxin oxidoreductase alpha subunit